jgi:hypothetical protein
MGDPAVVTIPQAEKKFKTQLTDFSVRREGDRWPYTSDIDVDALIVGAGFSKSYDGGPSRRSIYRLGADAFAKAAFSCSKHSGTVGSRLSSSKLAMTRVGLGGGT